MASACASVSLSMQTWIPAASVRILARLSRRKRTSETTKALADTLIRLGSGAMPCPPSHHTSEHRRTPNGGNGHRMPFLAIPSADELRTAYGVVSAGEPRVL